MIRSKSFKLLIILLFVSVFSYGQFFGSGSHTMGDVFHSQCCLLGKYKITFSPAVFYSKITYQKQPGEYVDYQRNGFNFNISYKFYKEFQVRFNFYADFNQNKLKPKWLSNMYYAVGNYNWRNKTFSYGYENYQPNRFDGSYDFFENMKRGFFFVSYNYYLLGDFISPVKLDETTQVYFSPFIRYFYEYTDRTGTRVLGHHKVVPGLNARYVIWHNFYVEGGVYAYWPVKSKMPWDPDFTYGFGYFDWRSFRLNFSYGNWVANRFPWNGKEMKNDFTNGIFTFSYQVIW